MNGHPLFPFKQLSSIDGYLEALPLFLHPSNKYSYVTQTCGKKKKLNKMPYETINLERLIIMQFLTC